MSSLDFLALLATTFGVTMGLGPLLQALRAHKRKSSADISLGFLSILLLGAIVWLSYGIALGNTALMIGNSVGVLSSSIAIAITLRWRRGESETA